MIGSKKLLFYSSHTYKTFYDPLCEYSWIIIDATNQIEKDHKEKIFKPSVLARLRLPGKLADHNFHSKYKLRLSWITKNFLTLSK